MTAQLLLSLSILIVVHEWGHFITARTFKIKVEKLDSAAAKVVLKTEVAPALLKVSKCPDLIEDRGHYFGRDLSDGDKRALIEFVKTL